MESAVLDFFSLSDHSNVNGDLCVKKPPYKSFIRVNGKSILPPIINEEIKREMQIYKQKAIETEKKLAKLKKNTATLKTKIPSDNSSTLNLRLSRQSTPTRPATLSIPDKSLGIPFRLAKSRTDGSLDRYTSDDSISDTFSSQIRSKSLNRSFRSSLEQRLAMEDGIVSRSKPNKCQQSPIIEEQITDKIINSDTDSKTEKKWSPLKIDSINTLQIQQSKNLRDSNENPEISVDESQKTPDTMTESPNLMRQNSYTILTPSPALLSFLENHQDADSSCNQRPQSGRKTWDLNKAKQNWDSSCNKPLKSSDEEGPENILINKKNSSSMDSFSVLQFDPDYQTNSLHNSVVYDSGTSFDSNSPKNNTKRTKFKRKSEMQTFETKCVPFQRQLKSPSKHISSKSDNLSYDSLPFEVKNDLTDLSDLLLKMKMDHVRQKKELEEKQQYEMKKLEILFKKKEADLLGKVNQLPRKWSKSIYSQTSREVGPKEFDMRVMGDGSHNRAEREKLTSVSEQCVNQYSQSRRPQSAKDFHSQFSPFERDFSRRARSMDFNQGNQETDLDVSFQDDFTSKDTTLNNEYVIESDSISNFSSHSSTVSSENRHEHVLPRCSLKKFQGLTSEEYAKYNQAATKITAAARGFLTRRLLRTAHVQGLITTLRDAITCATQLHSASDIADSDIDLMKRLGRQIEAAWDAVYSVFFTTETSTKLQLISTDRERLRAATTKTPVSSVKKKRISSATKKFLDRKKGGSMMSKSQTSNGFSRVRTCTKMTASYPSPYFPQELK